MRCTTILVTAASLLVGAANAGAQTPNFAGSWTRIADPNAPAMGGAGVPDSLTIAQDAKTLTIITHWMRGNDVQSVFNLDGTESKNTTTEGDGIQAEYVSHTKWDGSELVVTSVRHVNGASSSATFTYALDASGNLIVAVTLPVRGGGPPSVSASYKRRIVPRTDSTVVILLGTGNPAPIPEMSGPATAIVVGSRVFLFDAGAGVMRRMTAAKLPISGPTAVFITHLHSDHTLGYPDLIFTTWTFGRRKTPLEVYGPHGLQAMTDHIIAAWKEDIDVRTAGLAQLTPKGYAVHVHEISPGVVYDSAGVKITAIPVLHGNWKEAYGYRVDTPDRSIVLSGDTRPSAALEQAARNVDVLIHEVYQEAESLIGAPTPADGPVAYRRAFHTSDVELGRLAAAAKPKLLVLYHHAMRPDGGATMLARIRGEGYEGRIVFGKDLDRF